MPRTGERRPSMRGSKGSMSPAAYRARRPPRAARVDRYALCALRVLGLSLALLALSAAPLAARAETLTYRPGAVEGGCSAPASLSREARLACYAPAWVVEDAERSYNRIGTPLLRRGWTGGLRVRVDPQVPALYAE